jgi:hypothetical protein
MVVFPQGCKREPGASAPRGNAGLHQANLGIKNGPMQTAGPEKGGEGKSAWLRFFPQPIEGFQLEEGGLVLGASEVALAGDEVVQT